MKLNHKNKAFTLNEIILAMIISIIIIGISFSVLIIVQKQMAAFRKNLNEARNISQLNELLWLDFNLHENIEYKQKMNKLLFVTNKDSVTYFFYDDKTIRNLDTLDVSIKSINTFFEDKISTKPIDAVKLAINSKRKSDFIFVYRRNDSFQYFK